MLPSVFISFYHQYFGYLLQLKLSLRDLMQKIKMYRKNIKRGKIGKLQSLFISMFFSKSRKTFSLAFCQIFLNLF